MCWIKQKWWDATQEKLVNWRGDRPRGAARLRRSRSVPEGLTALRGAQSRFSPPESSLLFTVSPKTSLLFLSPIRRETQEFWGKKVRFFVDFSTWREKSAESRGHALAWVPKFLRTRCAYAQWVRPRLPPVPCVLRSRSVSERECVSVRPQAVPEGLRT